MPIVRSCVISVDGIPEATGTGAPFSILETVPELPVWPGPPTFSRSTISEPPVPASATWSTPLLSHVKPRGLVSQCAATVTGPVGAGVDEGVASCATARRPIKLRAAAIPPPPPARSTVRRDTRNPSDASSSALRANSGLLLSMGGILLTGSPVLGYLRHLLAPARCGVRKKVGPCSMEGLRLEA
jgi:hypothetical protein